MKSRHRSWWTLVLALAAASCATADVRVQDIARLQGERTNKLMGYGLVVGLSGTGDGDTYLPTMRALMRLHERYHAPVLTDADLAGNKSVALVSVEATIPEHGARAGQTLDVTISVIGAASSLQGGQLLLTPLQYAMFDAEDPATQAILALAGGAVHVIDVKAPTRGLIRGGATLERDFFYNFIDEGHITLVLDEAHAGWQWAHVVARAVNHELTSPAESEQKSSAQIRQVVASDYATAIGPKNVVVLIPPYELVNPANYITRVLQTPLFMLPKQPARVIIDRKTNSVSFTGAVTVSPTILQIPGLGTIVVGNQRSEGGPRELGEVGAIEFSELLQTLSAVKISPEQLVSAIEQLHRTGTLHAQLHYE